MALEVWAPVALAAYFHWSGVSRQRKQLLMNEDKRMISRDSVQRNVSIKNNRILSTYFEVDALVKYFADPAKLGVLRRSICMNGGTKNDRSHI